MKTSEIRCRAKISYRERCHDVGGAAPKVTLSYIRFFYQTSDPIAGSHGIAIPHEFAKYTYWGLLIQHPIYLSRRLFKTLLHYFVGIQEIKNIVRRRFIRLLLSSFFLITWRLAASPLALTQSMHSIHFWE